MIILDANVLIYAYNGSSPQHAAAKAWLEDALSGPDQIGFPLVSVLAFLRLVTQAAVFKRPLSPDRAFDIVDSWLAASTARMVHPTDRHMRVFRRVAAAGQARGALMTDAHLAALALEHGAQLCTTDRDFTRFDGLRLIDPLG